MIKINKIIRSSFCMAAVLALATSCSDDNSSFVLRSDNHVDLAYTATAGTFTVCTDGAWKVSSTANWFTVSPAEGTGDGSTREVVTITPMQNTGAARTDSVYLEAAGKRLSIGINQAEGFAKVGTPSFVGSLIKKKAATGCYISVPYSKAVEGQTYTAKVTMTGASGGLTVADVPYKAEASGTIRIPVTGTPTMAGTLTFSVSTGLPNTTAVSVSTIVANGAKETLLSMDFAKFVYGGDDANYVSGLKKDGVTVVTPRTDGSGNVFLTESDAYREAHGVTGWSGDKVYERPGYVKMGTASANGYIQTPALGLDETQDVILTFDAMNWDELTTATVLTITVTDGGTADVSTFSLPVRVAATAGTWSTVTVNIAGATSATKIKIAGGARFLIDNIKVTTTGL